MFLPQISASPSASSSLFPLPLSSSLSKINFKNYSCTQLNHRDMFREMSLGHFVIGQIQSSCTQTSVVQLTYCTTRLYDTQPIAPGLQAYIQHVTAQNNTGLNQPVTQSFIVIIKYYVLYIIVCAKLLYYWQPSRLVYTSITTCVAVRSYQAIGIFQLRYLMEPLLYMLFIAD